MKSYSINIAKAYTMKDWQGLPAHRFEARMELNDTLHEDEALDHLKRLEQVYPWPEYHLTLKTQEVVTRSEVVVSTADPEFLTKHRWNYPSTRT